MKSKQLVGIGLLRAVSRLWPAYTVTEPLLRESLARRGEFAAAEATLVQACAEFIVALGTKHPRTRRTRQWLIKLYEAWDKPEKVAEY